MAQPPPITIAPLHSSPKNPATIIFIHGFSDDAESWTELPNSAITAPPGPKIGLVSQFHSASKLPHATWILPTAPLDHESMARAWYTPRPFSALPMPKRMNEERREEDKDADTEEEADDIEGWKRSISYIRTLIRVEISSGRVQPDRVVVAGFSQGAAVSLGVGLGIGTSDFRTTEAESDLSIAGIGALSGFLPWSKTLEKEISSRRSTETQFWLAHGSRDMLVPGWVARRTRERVEGLIGETRVRGGRYEGVGHAVTGRMIGDFCRWLEGVIPE